jgi:iron complex transport system substrate-binding protein
LVEQIKKRWRCCSQSKQSIVLILVLLISITSDLHSYAVAHRIVSLAPSDTELLYAIDAQDQLLGVSTFCDFPPQAKEKEKVGSFVSVNMEKLARLKPDLVLLVNGQESLAMSLQHHSYKTVVLPNDHLNQIAKNLIACGELTGHQDKANAQAKTLSTALNNLAQIIRKSKTKPRVFFCVWPEPLLAAGGNCFLNEVITACGGVNIAANLPQAYPRFSLERLVLSDPDMIILPHEAEGQKFLAKTPWSNLRAVKNKKVYYLPSQDKDRLSRPTPRILDGLFWLASKLHPELQQSLNTWRSK